MENGETFYGMSSTNEYWNSSTETSSDGSSVETLPRNKENRDVSCNVNFDEELDKIIDEEESAVEKSSRKSVNLTQPTIGNCVECKSSRYIRWDVLMSLGIGMWAVLCIVDVWHSEKSVTIEWLYESAREKKNVSKTLSIKKPAPYVWWFFNPWLYLWSIMSISNAGGAFMLLFLVVIVFCTDPRLHKNSGYAAVKRSLTSKIHPNRVQDPIVENKPVSVGKKLPVIVEPTAQKVVPVKLELRPAIYLHARILSSIEEHVVYELMELKTECQCNFGVQDGFSHTPEIIDANSQTEYRKAFSVEKGLLARLDIAGYGTFNFTNISRLDRPSITTIYPTHSNNGNYAVRTLHLKIEEYMRKGKQYSRDVDGEWFANARGTQTTGESTELLNTKKGNKRIITSSPAFKKFLLRLKCNNASSIEIATTSQVFRNHLQDI